MATTKTPGRAHFKRAIKTKTKKKSIKYIYIVFYEPYDYTLPSVISYPIKSFANYLSADRYARSCNFEFQVLSTSHEDLFDIWCDDRSGDGYIIDLRDLRTASNYIFEEYAKIQTKKHCIFENIWDIICSNRPYIVMQLEFCNKQPRF